MKYGMIAVVALLVCGAMYAAQDTDLSQREVRDPRQLETWLETNATDAEARLASLETSASSNAVGIFYGKDATFTNTLTVGKTVTIPAGALTDASVVNADLATGIDSAKLLAGSTVTAINGAAITNLSPAKIVYGATPFSGTVTGVVYEGTAKTSDWVFVSGALISGP